MSKTPLVSTTHLLEGAEVAQLLVEVRDDDWLAAGREHHLHVGRGLGPRGDLVVVTRAGRRRRLGIRVVVIISKNSVNSGRGPKISIIYYLSL